MKSKTYFQKVLKNAVFRTITIGFPIEICMIFMKFSTFTKIVFLTPYGFFVFQRIFDFFKDSENL